MKMTVDRRTGTSPGGKGPSGAPTLRQEALALGLQTVNPAELGDAQTYLIQLLRERTFAVLRDRYWWHYPLSLPSP